MEREIGPALPFSGAQHIHLVLATSVPLSCPHGDPFGAQRGARPPAAGSGAESATFPGLRSARSRCVIVVRQEDLARRCRLHPDLGRYDPQPQVLGMRHESLKRFMCLIGPSAFMHARRGVAARTCGAALMLCARRPPH
jgi:hypothetical protein